MKTKKSAAADFLASPSFQAAESPDQSATDYPPMKFAFNFDGFNNATTSSSLKKKRGVAIYKSSDVTPQPSGASSPLKNPSSIADLKALASARLESMKRQYDRSHSDFLKDVEAFQSRLHKRAKIQTQACQQAMDEAEKEYKKLTDRISESQEAMKASYMEFITEAQASASRVCKTSIPELAQSLEKSIGSLRNRYCSASTSG